MLIRLVMLAASAMIASSAPAQSLEVRRAVVERTADLIRERYVDPKAGARIATSLKQTWTALPPTATAEAFATALTQYLRDVSGDGHFGLEYNPGSTAVSEGDVIDPGELERWYGAKINHGFEQVRRLENGIGYLDLRVFAPVAMGGELASASMSLLAQSPALIIDLRQNGGGYDDMTRLLAAYLLDEPREVSAEYDRPSGRTTRHFTPAQVAGRKFGGNKPVFILVSKRTFSAAEAFAYDLQAMKRAMVIGEQTGGGAHPFGYRPVSHGFVLALPEGRSINPITGRDWEGTGVTPDARVPADAALERALLLAKAALARDDAQLVQPVP